MISITFYSEAQTENYVTKMPSYPGGQTEMMKFIAKNIIYPSAERDNGTQGKVVAKFVVMKDGRIDSIKIIKSLGRDFDEEVQRVIKLMPPWNPGELNGNPVNTNFNLPVIFNIDDEGKSLQDDDIDIVISNKDSDETIHQYTQNLMQKNFLFYCKKIKRNRDGSIKSIYIHIASSRGSVNGTYMNFSSIRIFNSKEKGIGISPVSLN